MSLLSKGLLDAQFEHCFSVSKAGLSKKDDSIEIGSVSYHQRGADSLARHASSERQAHRCGLWAYMVSARGMRRGASAARSNVARTHSEYLCFESAYNRWSRVH